MPGIDSFVQVAIDGAGKKMRNFLNTIAGNDVYQEVITLAKSDGTVIDDPSRSSVTQPVSGTFFQATQPVSATALPLPVGAATEATLATRTKPSDQQHAIIDSGSVAVSNFPATQPVSGSVSVSNFPATQPVSAVALPLPTGAATDATLTTIDTDIKAQAKLTDTQPVSIAAPVAVTGAFFQAVQPISGTVALSGAALESLGSMQRVINMDFLNPRRAFWARRNWHA